MSSGEKRVLVASIATFLRAQLASDEEVLSADARESLEVGVQCIEAAYELSGEGAAAVQTVDLLKLVRDHLAVREVSPEAKAEAERLKNEGNELMKSDKYSEALERYTQAIQVDKHNAVFFCNRAAAHFKLNDNEAAVKDCLSALAIDPNYSKAHGRLGLAYTNLDRHNEARAAYSRALQLEPDNESYRTNLRVTEERLSQSSRANGGNSMNFGALLQNPALMNMATEMLSDPAMQNLISGLVGPGLQNNTQNPDGMNALLEAGQMLAQHMQSANPDLVEQLRRQMQPPSGDGSQQNIVAPKIHE